MRPHLSADLRLSLLEFLELLERLQLLHPVPAFFVFAVVGFLLTRAPSAHPEVGGVFYFAVVGFVHYRIIQPRAMSHVPLPARYEPALVLRVKPVAPR